MAFSYNVYTGDGTTTQFAVPFGYIRREHVLATVAGSPATFTWINDSLIQMDVVPANGATVRVYRQTPLTSPLVDFTDGSTLVAADLDTNAKQSIYTQQELDDSLVDGLAGVIPNGDKGDITTSVNGSVWTIDNGAVTSAKIADGTIVDGDISASAEIAVSKLADGTARQLLQTDTAGTGVEWTSNVDVPGTLDVTGAATFDSTVTATGDVTVPSLNGGPLAGARNLLINGNPIINQRGYVSGTATSGANEYTLDRWRVVTSGQSISWTDSNNVRTVTAPAGGVEQVIEGLSILSGTYTLSWTGTATATVDGNAVVNGGQVTLTGGTNATVRFSSGTFSLAQLEVGTKATPLERRNYGQELALCQRYYQKGVAILNASPVTGAAYLPVVMRAIPTVTTISIDSGTGGAWAALSNSTLYQSAFNSASSGSTYAASAEL